MTRILAIGITLGAAAAAAFLSWILSGVFSSMARRHGAMDQPTGGRKIHDKPTPLWGGIGIASGMFIVILMSGMAGLLMFKGGLSINQLVGYLVGIIILLLGGVLDDARPQKPWIQILFPIGAALAIIIGGTGITQVTSLAGRGGFSLVWWQGWGIALPSDLITFLWLLFATYSTKILDGLDGLVSGLAVIGAGLVGALSLSPSYFQPAVGILSGIVGGSFLGFLPRNMHPAKQFLGEAGATIAGFSLGVLAILSSAKIAIALAVLAIPMADIVVVVIGRLRRGAPWYKGDDTHLHFRLLKAGVPHRAAVFLLWGVSLASGIVALTLQTSGKLFLIGFLVVVAAVGSYAAGLKAKAKI